jgi:hypothetical protein
MPQAMNPATKATEPIAISQNIANNPSIPRISCGMMQFSV